MKSEMKPILILGPARAGKSTLSRLLKARLPNYNIVHGDALRNAIMYGLPERFSEEILHYEANDYFARLALKFIETQYEQDKGEQGVIFEGSQILPHHLQDSELLRRAVVVYIGHGGLGAEELFQMIRRYDTPKDWSYEVPDEVLRPRVEYFAQVHQRFAEECARFGYDYVDTATERAETLAKLAVYICKVL